MSNADPASQPKSNGKDDLVAQALRTQQFATGSVGLDPNFDTTLSERIPVRTEAELFRIAEDWFSEHSLPAEAAERCASHRKHTAEWASPIANRVGVLNEKTWRHQLDCTLKAIVDQQRASQPNGRWELLRATILRGERIHPCEVPVGPVGSVDPATHRRPYETVGERRAYFICAFELVDTLGEPDIVYVLGKAIGYAKRPGEELAVTEAMVAQIVKLQERAAEVRGGQPTSPELASLAAENAALKEKLARIEERLDAMLEPSGE